MRRAVRISATTKGYTIVYFFETILLVLTCIPFPSIDTPTQEEFVVSPQSILNYVEVSFIKKFVAAINKVVKLVKQKRFL